MMIPVRKSRRALNGDFRHLDFVSDHIVHRRRHGIALCVERGQTWSRYVTARMRVA